MKITVTVFLLLTLALISFPPAKAELYQPQVTKLENWLLMNRDQATGLPHSHVGDDRFENWAITYDSAIGHEYNTPKKGNLSTIGVSYAILALTGFDPLVNPAEKVTR